MKAETAALNSYDWSIFVMALLSATTTLIKRVSLELVNTSLTSSAVICVVDELLYTSAVFEYSTAIKSLPPQVSVIMLAF